MTWRLTKASILRILTRTSQFPMLKPAKGRKDFQTPDQQNYDSSLASCNLVWGVILIPFWAALIVCFLISKITSCCAFLYPHWSSSIFPSLTKCNDVYDESTFLNFLVDPYHDRAQKREPKKRRALNKELEFPNWPKSFCKKLHDFASVRLWIHQP